jgi:hypothetical protein
MERGGWGVIGQWRNAHVATLSSAYDSEILFVASYILIWLRYTNPNNHKRKRLVKCLLTSRVITTPTEGFFPPWKLDEGERGPAYRWNKNVCHTLREMSYIYSSGFFGTTNFWSDFKIIWTSDVCSYMKTKIHSLKHLRRAAVRFQCKSLNITGNRGHMTSASDVLCWPVKRFLWRNWFCEVCNTYTFLFVSPGVPFSCRTDNLTKTCLVCSSWL